MLSFSSSYVLFYVHLFIAKIKVTFTKISKFMMIINYQYSWNLVYIIDIESSYDWNFLFFLVSNVTVALQSEDGKRYQDDFNPDTMLLDILKKFISDM